MQPALRGFIEEFSDNCQCFILTCNYKNRIIQPLHSRCTCIEFKIPKSEKPHLASQFMDRNKTILSSEGVTFDEKVLAEVIMKHFPDFRRILNELQRYSVSGTIDVGILSQIGEIRVKDLVTHMKKKEFTNVRNGLSITWTTTRYILLERFMMDSMSSFLLIHSSSSFDSFRVSIQSSVCC